LGKLIWKQLKKRDFYALGAGKRLFGELGPCNSKVRRRFNFMKFNRNEYNYEVGDNNIACAFVTSALSSAFLQV
jgi:hypothetical protein